MRALFHYLIALAVLIIYGTQICPYLDTLSLTTLSADIGGFMALAFLLRYGLIHYLIDREDPLVQVRKQFFLEMGVFASAGLAMALYNMAAFDFPFGSGVKLILGSCYLGLFAATDITLARERQVALAAGNDPKSCLVVQKFFPLTRKFSIIASLLTILTGGILILVLLHDLDWIKSLPADVALKPATRSIIIEISFIQGVLLLYVINLIVSYARNLKLYFDRQTTVLEEVSTGRFDGHVPVTSNDEFAVIARYTNDMIEGLRERTEALQRTQDVTIRALASLAETRDNETGQHILRTQYYVQVLAEDLKSHPDFASFLDARTIDLLFKSAPLHDVGKVGVADAILLKPGKLTEEEFAEMKNHTVYGRDALQNAEASLGENSFLRYATEIAYSHHEKWDGSGYPRALKGKDIPMSGRLMAIADVYDALISKRVYKPAFSHDKAYSIIIEGKGSHFDPVVVDAFIRQEEEFKKIAKKYQDKEQSIA